LPAGCNPQTWFAALATACARIQAYAPQALVVSLGLDTFAGDPITHFKLTAPDFTRLGQVLAGLGLPTVFVFEGGYANAELAVNTVNVLEGFDSSL
jgi:acetoin utilization deacetylase AcuC-like enzyme